MFTMLYQRWGLDFFGVVFFLHSSSPTRHTFFFDYETHGSDISER